MLHHISFGVTNLARSAAFYDFTLSALGYVRVWSGDTAGFHFAFAAPSRDAVALFHAAALQHGGADNGAPGLRPDYGDNYYAAFVVDPDGYRVEAVINAAA